MHPLIESLWYKTNSFSYLLSPLAALFGLVADYRKQSLIKKQAKLPVPIIVVGNINVGGTGKTPVVLALVDYFTRQGKKVGVVSRGYGSESKQSPYRVHAKSTSTDAGDEPLLIFNQTGCPVIVDADRVKACRVLIDEDSVDLIISDDGLQHYRMPRTIELAVVDGKRGLGNGRLLPAGPLREPPERLKTVDKVLINGHMQLPLPECSTENFSLALESLSPLGETIGDPTLGKVHAVAGIGNPARFFESLSQLGFDCIEHPFADHYAFSNSDVLFDDTLPVIMTAKDAVKCCGFSQLDRHWVLPVNAQFEKGFWQWLDGILLTAEKREKR